MKIKRPDWWNIDSFYQNQQSKLLDNLQDWFDTHVEPINKLLGEGVEVYGSMETNNKTWTPLRDVSCRQEHKALLIGVTKINQETAEDILKYITEKWESVGGINDQDIQRAKALLEKK